MSMNAMNPMVASRLMANRLVVQLLSVTFHESLSAQQIGQKLDISIAMAYRKICELEAVGWVKVTHRVLTKDGKRIKMYRSLVRGAFVYFDENKSLRVLVDLVGDDKPDDSVWSVMDDMGA